MKIIFSRPRSELEAHAKRMVKELRKQEFSTHNPLPLGIPVHTAKYPIDCDDCGVTYWASDVYAAHRGCRSGKSVGF